MPNSKPAPVSVKEIRKEQTDMHKVIRVKNNLLIQQTRKIKLLEDKMTEWRKKYFQLKYSDVIAHLKTA